MKPVRLATALAVCLCLPAAELEWQPRQRHLQAQPGQDTLQTSYRLHNTGDEAIQVVSLRTTCGCGSLRIDDKQVAAGEQTTLHLSYSIGDRVGEQRHLILVETRQGDAQAQQHRLGITVSIPEPVRLSRSVAFWRKAGPGKAISISIETAEGVRVTGVEAPDAVQADLDATGEQTWTLRLTPASTTAAVHEQCCIQTSSSDARYARLPVTVLIK